MTSVNVNHAIILSAVLFATGLVGVMVRRNLVFILMSLEIMLAAAGVAFVAAASKWHQPDGQVVVIFILVTAAAEVAVGLSLVLRIYHEWKSVDVDEVSLMKG
jgi:NADH-quinone oxidoreductase subunit K